MLISSCAFTLAKNITSIEIPSTVTEIDDLTFYLQRNLKSVTIPDSVEEMGVDAFAECTALTEVIVSDQFIATFSVTKVFFFVARETLTTNFSQD